MKNKNKRRRSKKTSKKNGYEALDKLIGLVSKSKGKPMGASGEDRIIYDIQ